MWRCESRNEGAAVVRGASWMIDFVLNVIHILAPNAVWIRYPKRCLCDVSIFHGDLFATSHRNVLSQPPKQDILEKSLRRLERSSLRRLKGRFLPTGTAHSIYITWLVWEIYFLFIIYNIIKYYKKTKK